MRRPWKDGKKKSSKRKDVNEGNYFKGPPSWKKEQRQKRRTIEKRQIREGKDLYKVPPDWYL